MDIECQRSETEHTQIANTEVDYKPNVADDDPLPSDGPCRETEEMLPLYTESHIEREADGSMKPPDANATPDQVRDFIVELLTTKRNLHIDHARRIAAKWAMGNGKEMRTYPPSMYREIFGFEDGWIVYKEVHVVLCMATWWKDIRKDTATCGIVFLAIWFLAAGLLIGLTEIFPFVGVIMILIGCFASIFIVKILLLDPSKPRDAKEAKDAKDAREGAEAGARARVEARLLAAFDTRPSRTDRP